jgi:hypothetical protein
MLQIDDTIVSLDILDKHFRCNLAECKGMCCVHGDSGAPLEPNEVVILRDIFPKLKSYLREEGIRTIEAQGTSVTDTDGDTVTPLIEGRECAYTVFDKGIAFCGIEHAFIDGKIQFKKPISCHLYPIRVKKYAQFRALNYDQWEICEPARRTGEIENIPVFEFLKESIVRAFGKPFYSELKKALKDLARHRKSGRIS